METVGATDYYDIAQAFDPDVSPDGDRVAFVRRQPDGGEEYEDTVYVAAFGGETRRFTAEAGRDAEPRWSPSGDRLAFTSTRGDGDAPQLWVLPADGGEARQVTDIVGGVSSIAWSPDGERVAFVQPVSAEERDAGHDLVVDDDYEREPPDPRVIDRMVYRAHEHYYDGRRSHVYVADLADDSVERVTDGDVDHACPAWSDADTLHYVTRRRDPDDSFRYDVDVHDLSSGDVETLVETSGLPYVAVAGDGRVAYHYTPEDRFTLQQGQLRVYDPDGDETYEPTADLDRSVDVAVGHKPAGFEWGPDDDQVYFVTPDEGAYVVWRAPGDASADPEPASTGRHVHGFSTGGDALAVTASEWDHPGDAFASTLGGGEETRLTRLNADYLDDRAVGQPEELRFESEDGVEVQGWVLTPPGFDPDDEYPLVVEVHGGPHSMWTTSGTMWHEFQTLAARGYVVFWCNPRGSSGYGEAFMSAIERDWGDVTAADVLAGVETVAARDYVDDDEVFVTGGSFGGYMTAWLVGNTDRFDAAVAQRGVYDLASFYGSTDLAFKLVEGDFGTTPWDEPEFLWEHSPAAYADQVDAPTLVLHAENDYRVPVDGAELLFRGLKKHGVETRFVRYPDEGHELSRSGQPAHVVDRIERIARWFDGYSSHHDAPKALERGDEGLSAGEQDDEGDEDSDGE